MNIRTSEYIAETLREMGIEVHSGIGGTGIVGNLRFGSRGALRYVPNWTPFLLPNRQAVVRTSLCYREPCTPVDMMAIWRWSWARKSC